MAQTQQPEITVKLTMDGMGKVRAELSGLSAQAQRTQGRIQAFGKAVKNDFAKLGTSLLTPFTNVFAAIRNGIAGLAFAVPTVGLAGFLGTLNSIKSATIEAATEINRLSRRAEGLNVKGIGGQSAASVFGALEAMLASAAGLQDGDNMKDIISTLLETAVEAQRGDQGAKDKMNLAGLIEDDFFIKGTDQFKEIPEILQNIARAQKAMSQEKSVAAMVGLLGDEDGIAAASLFKMTEQQMRDFIKEYGRLTDIRKQDEGWSRALVQEMNAFQAALMGAKTAIGRGYGDSLTESFRGFKELLVTIRPDLQQIGDEFGNFSEGAAGRVETSITRILGYLKQGGKDISSGVLPSALESLQGKFDSVMTGAERVAEYLITGQTEHAEIKRWIDFLDNIYKGILGISKVILRIAEPIVNGLATGFEKLSGLVGPDSAGMIMAAGAALVYFRGSVLGGLKALIDFSGVVKGVTSALKSLIPSVGDAGKGFGAARDAIGGMIDKIPGIAKSWAPAVRSILPWTTEFKVSVGYIRTYIDDAVAATKNLATNSVSAWKEVVLGAENYKGSLGQVKGQLTNIIRQTVEMAAKAGPLIALGVGYVAVNEAENAVTYRKLLAEGNALAKQVAAQSGEAAGMAYGAAYIRAGSQRLRESGNMSIMARAGEYFEVDGEINEMMGQALALDAKSAMQYMISGANAGLQNTSLRIGAEVELKDDLAIAPGIIFRKSDIQSMGDQLEAEVTARFENGTPVKVTLEEVDMTKVVTPEGLLMMPAKVRVDEVDMSKFLDVSGKFLIQGGFADMIADATKHLTPVNITLESGVTLPTLFAPTPDVAREIESSISRGRRSKS